MEHETPLPRDVGAPSLARRALARWYRDALPTHELEVAQLVASEFVTNAIRHGVGAITFRAKLDEDRVLIEVIDEGSGFERRARQLPFDQLSGRGLSIVEATSSRWGIHAGTTHVWAEIERHGPRVGEHKKPE